MPMIINKCVLFVGMVWFRFFTIAISNRNNSCGGFACNAYLWIFLTVTPILFVVCSHILIFISFNRGKWTTEWNASTHSHRHRQHHFQTIRVIKIVFIYNLCTLFAAICVRWWQTMTYECVTLCKNLMVWTVDTQHSKMSQFSSELLSICLYYLFNNNDNSFGESPLVIRLLCFMNATFT